VGAFKIRYLLIGITERGNNMKSTCGKLVCEKGKNTNLTELLFKSLIFRKDPLLVAEFGSTKV
jgi:hypothetical protein